MRVLCRHKDLVWVLLFLVSMVCSCLPGGNNPIGTDMHYARYFNICQDPSGRTMVQTISPYDQSRDSFIVQKPLSRIICMSSTHVACLSAIGCDSVVVGVSGVDYLSNGLVAKSARDVGYESTIDYETILSLDPDLVVAYSVSDAIPTYVSRLRSLGIPVLVLSDHLENHPLARAEYVCLFGALTGRTQKAEEYIDSIGRQYNAIRDKVLSLKKDPVKILINMPYSGEWFVPGGDNYTSILIRDAGGEILGSVPGRFSSSVMSIEKAYVYSLEADLWLNPGYCSSVEEILCRNDVFSKFPVIGKGVYNNTLRTNSKGGNDIWESGSVHPEKVLSDLASIMYPEAFRKDSLEYYIEVK